MHVSFLPRSTSPGSPLEPAMQRPNIYLNFDGDDPECPEQTSRRSEGSIVEPPNFELNFNWDGTNDGQGYPSKRHKEPSKKRPNFGLNFGWDVTDGIKGIRINER